MRDRTIKLSTDLDFSLLLVPQPWHPSWSTNRNSRMNNLDITQQKRSVSVRTSLDTLKREKSGCCPGSCSWEIEEINPNLCRLLRQVRWLLYRQVDRLHTILYFFKTRLPYYVCVVSTLYCSAPRLRWTADRRSWLASKVVSKLTMRDLSNLYGPPKSYVTRLSRAGPISGQRARPLCTYLAQNCETTYCSSSRILVRVRRCSNFSKRLAHQTQDWSSRSLATRPPLWGLCPQERSTGDTNIVIKIV